MHCDMRTSCKECQRAEVSDNMTNTSKVSDALSCSSVALPVNRTACLIAAVFDLKQTCSVSCGQSIWPLRL